MKVAVFVLILTPVVCNAAEPAFPTAEGTTWNYEMIQEHPNASFDLTDPNEEEHFAVTYRIGGAEKVDNKELQRLEIYRGNALETVDLIAIEEHGVTCPARMDADGAITKLIPPQQMLDLPLQSGTTWSFDGKIGDTNVKQQYEITGEEDVRVPAGKFRAWRIHCEQSLPAPAMIDRWFVPATGFVKVQTVVKGASGSPLQKTSLELKEPPKIVPAPPKAADHPGKLLASVSNEARGELKTEFKADTPAIYARWSGRGLPDHAKIRAVFIAENVADVSADSQVDESNTAAPATNSSGTFTLSKPGSDWTPGNYRVEFYVDDRPAATVKFKVSK
jgi:hypothetical protein